MTHQAGGGRDVPGRTFPAAQAHQRLLPQLRTSMLLGNPAGLDRNEAVEIPLLRLRNFRVSLARYLLPHPTRSTLFIPSTALREHLSGTPWRSEPESPWRAIQETVQSLAPMLPVPLARAQSPNGRSNVGGPRWGNSIGSPVDQMIWVPGPGPLRNPGKGGFSGGPGSNPRDPLPSIASSPKSLK